MDSTLILVVIGVIAATFGRSEAISCYVCASTSASGDSKCLDPFNPEGVPIREDATTCTKTLASGAGVTTVARSFSAASIESDKCDEVSEGGGTAKACYCKTDKCNDGQLVKPTTYSVIIGAAIATVTAMTWMNQI